MSETAAILKVLISPAGLFITILYFFTTGDIAFINPNVISPAERTNVTKNDHFLKSGRLCPERNPVSRSIGERMSEISNDKKAYSIKAIQNPPIIFSISVNTEE
jgi:hypothetical protein